MPLYKLDPRYIVAQHPNPGALLTPPWSVWYDSLERLWFIESPNRPENALAYGLKFEEDVDA